MRGFTLDRQYGSFSDGFANARADVYKMEALELEREKKQQEMQRWVDQLQFDRDVAEFAHNRQMERDLKLHQYKLKENEANRAFGGVPSGLMQQFGGTQPTPGQPGFYQNPEAVDSYVKTAAQRKKAAELAAWEKEQAALQMEEYDADFQRLNELIPQAQENAAMLEKGDRKAGDFFGIGGKNREELQAQYDEQEAAIFQRLKHFQGGTLPIEAQAEISARVAALPPDRIRRFFGQIGWDSAQAEEGVMKLLQSGAMRFSDAERIAAAFGYQPSAQALKQRDAGQPTAPTQAATQGIREPSILEGTEPPPAQPEPKATERPAGVAGPEPTAEAPKLAQFGRAFDSLPLEAQERVLDSELEAIKNPRVNALMREIGDGIDTPEGRSAFYAKLSGQSPEDVRGVFTALGNTDKASVIEALTADAEAGVIEPEQLFPLAEKVLSAFAADAEGAEQPSERANVEAELTNALMRAGGKLAAKAGPALKEAGGVALDELEKGKRTLSWAFNRNAVVSQIRAKIQTGEMTDAEGQELAEKLGYSLHGGAVQGRKPTMQDAREVAARLGYYR